VASGRGGRVRRTMVILLLSCSSSFFPSFRLHPLSSSLFRSGFSLGWQTGLEKDLLKGREVGSGILAKAQLLATGLAPKGLLLTHRRQHLLVALAHRLTALVFVIGQHVCCLMDQRIGLGECRPEPLGLLQATHKQAVQFAQSRRKAPLFPSTRESRVSNLG